MIRSPSVRALLLLAMMATLCILSSTGGIISSVAAEEEDSTQDKEEDMSNRKLAREAPKDDFDVKSHFEWGTYYDPKNIFCGKYDCYGILGFDYESFEKEKPDKKIITKRYRSLSRHWHPDKSKHPEAKERFVKIARAYEVLTKEDSRKEYDMMRYNQELYFSKYGSDVMFSFAPKSNTILVLIFVLAMVNGFVYFAQYNRWKKVCDRLAKAATEDWNPSQGGTPESKQLRERALELMNEDNDKKEAANATNGDLADSKKGGKKGMKLTSKEKKQKMNDELRSYVTKLAYEIEDFGAGFHKPTWKDMAMLKMAKFLSVDFATGVVWQVQYWMRRIQKLPLTEEEKSVLTERAVGHVIWEFASEEEKTKLVSKELWELKNLAEWNEEREFSKLSKSEQKQHKAMMKHQKQN